MMLGKNYKKKCLLSSFLCLKEHHREDILCMQKNRCTVVFVLCILNFSSVSSMFSFVDFFSSLLTVVLCCC